MIYSTSVVRILVLSNSHFTEQQIIVGMTEIIIKTINFTHKNACKKLFWKVICSQYDTFEGICALTAMAVECYFFKFLLIKPLFWRFDTFHKFVLFFKLFSGVIGLYRV